MKKYIYETHLHTSPVSKCAVASVEDTVRFYASSGYDGIFVTNHFLDSNINIERSKSYAEKLEFYFSDYRKAAEYGKDCGLKVFPGVEMSYGGTDFLIYGISEEWYANHSEIITMTKREELAFLAENGAFIVQAHPFREASYIDHIRLYPRSVEAVETINASRTEFENQMADIYADNYGLLKTAGSDNHVAENITMLAGIATAEPICSSDDYKAAVCEKRTELFFCKNTPEERLNNGIFRRSK